MRTVRFATAFVLFAFLLAGLAAVLAQQADLDRELEEAKALYREAKFAQAIARLQEMITRLRALQEVQVRKAQLVDAYLHLALSYVALNDRVAAKVTLKQMIRLDPDRRLDAEVYAPKVIELFEEARVEVAAEPPEPAQVPSQTVSRPPRAEPRKSSRLPYILIGAGGAAGAGLAALSGDKGSTVASTGSTTTTTTTTPGSSGQGDIVFLGSDPGPGSTISVGPTQRHVLFFKFSVTYYRNLPDANMYVRVEHAPESVSAPCFHGCAGGGGCPEGRMPLTAGQPRDYYVGVSMPPDNRSLPHCALPHTSTTVYANLQDGVAGTVLERRFNVSYNFVP